MYNTWLSSDWHIGHHKAIQLNDRPFQTLEEMERTLVRNWNSRVQDGDACYLLGDMFCNCKFPHALEVMKQLKGNLYLVSGNHDSFSATQYRMLGFKAVFDEVRLTVFNRSITLSHYPYKPSFFTRLTLPKYAKRFMDRRPINKGGWLIHGHVHRAWKIKDKMINVGVDVNGFYPVPLKEIQGIITRYENK